MGRTWSKIQIVQRDVHVTVSICIDRDVFREISGVMTGWVLPSVLLGVWVEMAPGGPKVGWITRWVLVNMNSVHPSCQCLNAYINV